MVQEQVRDIKKGEKDKAGTEVAREKKSRNLKNGKSQADPKALKSIWK